MMEQIARVHSVYGIVRVQLNDTMSKLVVDYDASRLSEADVETVLHKAGLPIVLACLTRGLGPPFFPAWLEQRQGILLLVRVLQDLLDVEVDAESRDAPRFRCSRPPPDTGFVTISFSHGSLNSSKISWMKKFGMDAFSWAQAAEHTGPWALCGAITPKCASTMSQILRAAKMPPRFSGSGWRIFTTSCCSNSANCCLVERLSPVAMGTGLRRATSTMAAMLVCGTGSSNQVGRSRRHCLRELDRGGNVEAAMAFDQQVHRGAHGIAHGTDDIQAEVEIVAGERAPGAAERVELHRGVAAARDDLRLFGKRLRRARSAIPAVGVRAQLLVAAAAPQVVDGLIAGLADDVPAGDLDRGHGAHVDLRAFGVDVANQASARGSRPGTDPCPRTSGFSSWMAVSMVLAK